MFNYREILQYHAGQKVLCSSNSRSFVHPFVLLLHYEGLLRPNELFEELFRIFLRSAEQTRWFLLNENFKFMDGKINWIVELLRTGNWETLFFLEVLAVLKRVFCGIWSNRWSLVQVGYKSNFMKCKNFLFMKQVLKLLSS